MDRDIEYQTRHDESFGSSIQTLWELVVRLA